MSMFRKINAKMPQVWDISAYMTINIFFFTAHKLPLTVHMMSFPNTIFTPYKANNPHSPIIKFKKDKQQTKQIANRAPNNNLSPPTHL